MEYTSDQDNFDQQETMPCLNCGVCCSRWQPQIDNEEANIIAQGLGISLEDLHRDYTQNIYQIAMCLLRRREGVCIFLKNDGEKVLCSIHAFKPKACHQWMPSLSHPECREGLRRQTKQ